MNLLKQEHNILNIIKYGPILFVMIISLFFTKIIIEEKTNVLQEKIIEIRKVYKDTNKKRVKEEVNRIFNTLTDEKKNFEESLKKQIKDRVYEAHKIATNIYLEESKPTKNGHMHDKNHIFLTIKNALGGIIFNNGRGYFFIVDELGNSLLQPLNKHLEDTNFLNHPDTNGYIFGQKMVDTINDKTENYDYYYWYKDNDKVNSYKKMSFYKYFAPFNIVIGTGEYIVDFEKELKEKLLEKIRKVKYGKDGYIFVYDTKGMVLSHFKRELIGVNRIKVKDLNGSFVVKNVIDFAQKEKNGFISYLATMKPNSKTTNREKISYVKYFKDWNWVIGSGFYLDELDNEILSEEKLLKKSNDKAIIQVIYTSLFFTIIFIIISFYISKLISKMFQKYKKNIENEIKKKVEKEKLLIQQSKMATMGEMIGSIAHQWKQPLSVISMSNGALRLAKEEKDMISEKIHAEALDNVDVAVENLSQTINDFSNFFNPNKSKALFKIEDALNETLKLISSQLKNNSIAIIKSISDIELSGYQNELQQTLINLLKNAKEELVKKASNEKRYIFIDVQSEKDNLTIKIKDNANGIPENILGEIFNSYFTTKEKNGGTGIGLYMSKQIIERNMKGKITVSNVEYTYENINYKGAEFIIYIPLDLRNPKI